MNPEERAFIERRLSELPSPSLPAGVEQLFAAYLRALTCAREAEQDRDDERRVRERLGATLVTSGPISVTTTFPT